MIPVHLERDGEQEADDKSDVSTCKEPSSPLMTVLQLRLNVGTKERGFHLFSPAMRNRTVWMHLSTLWYGDILIPFMSVQSVWAASRVFAFAACGLYDSRKSSALLLWVSRPYGDSCSSFVFWEESIRTLHSVASRLHIDTCFRVFLDEYRLPGLPLAYEYELLLSFCHLQFVFNRFFSPRSGLFSHFFLLISLSLCGFLSKASTIVQYRRKVWVWYDFF